jgi:hypothetical protein
MVTKIFQIATFGTFCANSILTRLKIYPSHKLVLICCDYDNTNAKQFTKMISSVDKNIGIIICMISRQNIIESVFGHFSRIVRSRSEISRFQRILLNVSSGDKFLTYAVLSAYIKGIETFMINSNFSDSPAVLPIPDHTMTR